MLAHYEANFLLRQRYVIEDRCDNDIILNNQKIINFSSNDYLAISTHQEVKKAFIRGAQQHGLGSGSASLVSGFYKAHNILEEKLAAFLQRDRAVLFNSGYMANLGVITTFANRSSKIYSDKLCHSSILDGIQLSRAKHQRFFHNNTDSLEKMIHNTDQSKIIVTEGVFSMEGSVSPLDKISSIANKHNAMLIVDDAHGVGVMGKNGKGTCEHYHLTQNKTPILIAPLGKAFGSMGAVVAGCKDKIEELIQCSRTYRYTTALPPAVACATIESLKIIEHESWRREKLQSIIKYFISQVKKHSLSLISEDITPIKSILIGNNQLALSIKEKLLEKGFFVSCIRPPTVPKNTARIRISLNCLHEENDIDHLLDILASLYESRNQAVL